MSIPDKAADQQFLIDIARAAQAMIERDPSRWSTIGTGDMPLAERLLAKRDQEQGSIYIHRWVTSDPDDLHDHPFDFVRIILIVGYWEITPAGRFWCAPGSLRFGRAEEIHRVELDETKPLPITLFIAGPVRRPWGFHTKDGWVEGKKYRSVEQYRRRRDGVA